jgi:hypothetical protein
MPIAWAAMPKRSPSMATCAFLQAAAARFASSSLWERGECSKSSPVVAAAGVRVVPRMLAGSRQAGVFFGSSGNWALRFGASSVARERTMSRVSEPLVTQCLRVCCDPFVLPLVGPGHFMAPASEPACPPRVS